MQTSSVLLRKTLYKLKTAVTTETLLLITHTELCYFGIV